MENFLNKEDYEFYKKSKDTVTPAGYCVLTNKGWCGFEPVIKEDITHFAITTYDDYLDNYKFNNYSKLHYFLCKIYPSYGFNDIMFNNIQFNKFNELKVLNLNSIEIFKDLFFNLPNIEVLIFSNIILDYFVKDNMKKYDFRSLDNLPITLNTIIFDGSEDDPTNYYLYEDQDKIIDFLKYRMSSVKIPFGCKTYFIDKDNKVHTIT